MMLDTPEKQAKKQRSQSKNLSINTKTQSQFQGINHSVSSKNRNITIEDTENISREMSSIDTEEDEANWIHMDFMHPNDQSIKDQVKQVNKEINQRYALMTQIHSKNKKLSVVQQL